MVSILLRYKRSTGSRGSSSSKYKKSSRRFVPGTAVRLLGAKNRKTIRPLRSRVPTICHNIFDDYVLWTRTKSGGYLKSRRKSLEVNFCEKYTLGEKLGSGGFGTVWAGVRNSNGAKARRIRWREKLLLALYKIIRLCKSELCADATFSLLLILLGKRWRSSRRQGHV